MKDTQSYSGHLFALEITDGIVTNVMARNNSAAPANNDHLLLAETFITADMGTNNIRNSTNGVWNAAGTQFPNSVGPNNPGGYTANTKAIYVRDTGSNVTHDQVTNTITVSGLTAPYAGCNGTYCLNPGVTKIVGDQLEYLNERPNNDLAIVFEQGGVKVVTQLYMTTGPNRTPGGISSIVTYEIDYKNDGTLDVTRKVDGVAAAPTGRNVSVNVRITNQNNAVIYDGTTTDFATGGWQEYTVVFDFDDCSFIYTVGPFLR